LRPEKSEVERLLADNTKARELLDWTPKVDLETGLLKTIEWLKSHLEFYQSNDYVV
jgi:nucleoside-diphosphate-sugar epimerase